MPEFTVQAFSSFTAVKRIFFLRIFKKRLLTKKHRIFILSCKYQSDCCNVSLFSLADSILHATSGASCISEYMQIQAQIKSLIEAMEIEVFES